MEWEVEVQVNQALILVICSTHVPQSVKGCYLEAQHVNMFIGVITLLICDTIRKVCAKVSV